MAGYRLEDTVCTRDRPHARHQLQVQEVSKTALGFDKSLERLRKLTESSCPDGFGLLQGKDRDSDQPQEEQYRAESHGSPQKVCGGSSHSWSLEAVMLPGTVIPAGSPLRSQCAEEVTCAVMPWRQRQESQGSRFQFYVSGSSKNEHFLVGWVRVSSALRDLPRGWDLACPEVWAGAESGWKPGLRVPLSVPSVAGSRVGRGEGRAGQGRGQWGSSKRPA